MGSLSPSQPGSFTPLRSVQDDKRGVRLSFVGYEHLSEHLYFVRSAKRIAAVMGKWSEG